MLVVEAAGVTDNEDAEYVEYNCTSDGRSAAHYPLCALIVAVPVVQHHD
ncbi:hypothetical protein [Mucilaginibacter sp. UYCu711]